MFLLGYCPTFTIFIAKRHFLALFKQLSIRSFTFVSLPTPQKSPINLRTDRPTSAAIILVIDLLVLLILSTEILQKLAHTLNLTLQSSLIQSY